MNSREQNNNGQTPMQRADSKQHGGVVKMLLKIEI